MPQIARPTQMRKASHKSVASQLNALSWVLDIRAISPEFAEIHSDWSRQLSASNKKNCKLFDEKQLTRMASQLRAIQTEQGEPESLNGVDNIDDVTNFTEYNGTLSFQNNGVSSAEPFATLVDGLTALLIAYVLPVVKFEPSSNGLKFLLQQLVAFSDQYSGDAPGAPQNLLIETLASVELPLVLMRNVSEFEIDEHLAHSISARMATAIADNLDHDGWPQAGLLPQFGPLIASWTRSMRLIRKMKIPLSPDADRQFEWAVKQLLRLLKPNRTLMMNGLPDAPVSNGFLKVLAKLTDDPADQKLIALVSEGNASVTKRNNRKSLGDSSSISEWSQSGLLRSNWNPKSPRLCFDCSNHGLQLELVSHETLISGPALPQIEWHGKRLSPTNDFEIVCNEHDHDLDYVELQMELSDEAILSRQLILSRDESFLLVIDSVVFDSAGRIEYCCDWPLADGIEVLPESETREVYLKTSKIQSLVLPLALPEWQVGKSPGRLIAKNANSDKVIAPSDSRQLLRMECAAEGRALCVPLFFDLSPKRCKQKRTWRQLTVGENMQPVPPEVATAFRIQVHKQQWFFYRVLTEKGNRTFLGENFQGEFVIGRFDKTGAVYELLRIE